MQEIKNHLKNIGEKFRASNPSHQESLRQKLIAAKPQLVELPQRHFAWFPVLSWSAAAVLIIVVGAKTLDRSVVSTSHQDLDSYSFEGRSGASDLGDVAVAGTTALGFDNKIADVLDDAGFADRYAEKTDADDINTQDDTIGDNDIVDYEEEHGTMLEQSVDIDLYTREDDAAETVSALFASLGGHLASIRNNDDDYATISGSIPASRLSFFYEQLDALVKNDAFIKKTLRGDSVTSEAIDLANREQALRDAEADVTAQLQAAKTDAEKKQLQENLESISEDMIQLTREKDVLDDRVDYVTVSVTVEKLPSLWGVQSARQLEEVIAGFEDPNLGQRILINTCTVFFVIAEFLSATFWILIPLFILFFVIFKRKRTLRELE